MIFRPLTPPPLPAPSPRALWRRSLRRLLALSLATGAAAAAAHDTWFERRPAATPARPEFILGTGNLFPVFDSRNVPEHLTRSGCRAGTTERTPLRVVDPAVESLVLGPAQDLPPAPRISCWAQLQSFDVELTDDLVELYFKEAQPPAAVRQAWAAQRARGQGWRERYVKHARVEWFPDPSALAEASAEPVGLDADALMLRPLRAPRVGDEAEFLVLKGGEPMRGQAVEFRLHNSRFGFWRRTDDQGRVKMNLPAAGRWLLRAIELTPPAAEGERWQAVFITLAFDTLPAAR